MNFKSFQSIKKIVLSLLLSAGLVSCRGLFFSNGKTYEKNLKFQPYDAVIVPGIPFENGKWNYIMKSRVLWSVYLYQHGYTKNVIYSGSSVYSPYVEARIMGMYAEKLGVPHEHIFLETRAQHSTENIFYGCMVAKKNNFKKIAIATDRFQSRTLSDYLPKIWRKTHIVVKSIPIQDQLLSEMPQDEPMINYELAHVDSFVSIVERESKWKRFWGTMGKHINYAEINSVDCDPVKSKSTE
jgi:hypothetical protein